MTAEEIGKMIAQGEGASIEFKKAMEKVPASLYETVVSFANTRGGYILLGVDDDGTVLGINPANKAVFDGYLHNMTWEEQISFLSLSWIEKVTKLEKKVTKLSKNEILKIARKNELQYADVQYIEGLENEIGDGSDKKKRLSLIEKVTKLPSKRLQYFISILVLSGKPISIDDLTDMISFNHRTYFNENYLKPLLGIGFLQRTNPDKPTASNQKYLITEQGKRFLTGQSN